ncbi:AraC family transcriptional regulator [Cohnella silvisoli]|uniref:Helix-turn-helix domain-containing protein n=1 Tax=Cohnella silvisoli TaxID=2873699 RepID=A0ABV1L003_9BACL|nr:AraC family transcriptional regulator [Cohnella silvisoli]MCD9024873.1 helix-turn-helix domain-containing protein [Cohnella silvisoli]
MKRLLRPKGIFNRMFLLITIAIVILLLMLSVSLYLYYNRVSVEMIKKSNLKTLSQISYSVDYMNENARNFTFSIFGDPFVTQLMYGDHFDRSESFSELDRLKQLVNTNAFIHSMYIYNRKLNLLVPIMGASDRGNAPTLDVGLQDFIQHYQTNAARFVPIPRQISVDTSSAGSSLPQQSNVYTYVAYDLTTESSGIEGAVIVNIKGDYLKNIIHSLNVDDALTDGDDGKTFIVGDDGTVVNDAEDGLYLKVFADQSILRKIRANQAGAGYFVDTMDRRKVIVTYVTADSVRWTLVKITPTETIDKQTRSVQWIILAVCFLILCLGLAVSFWLSRRLATPFQQLVGQARKLSGKSHSSFESKDEVAFLFNAFSETSTKVQLLESIEKDRIHQRRNEWLQQLLLNGGVSAEEINDSIAKLDLPINTENPYLLILLKIDRYVEFIDRFSEKDRILFRYAICNVAKEVLNSDFRVQAFDMGQDTVAIIANVPDSLTSDIRKRMSDLLEDIQEWVQLNLKLSLTAANSYVGKNWDELHVFYQEVITISKCRLVYGHGMILWPDMMLQEQQSSVFKIPAKLEKQLGESLTQGKLEEAWQIYESFIAEVSKYACDTIHSALLMLTYSIFSSLKTFESNGTHLFQFDLAAFISEIGSTETLEEINRKYYALFTQMTAAATANKPKRNTAMAETIVALIESNYADKSLCLESISGTLNFSKVYVGKVFRDVYGISVADYITDYRFKKVVELLDQGNQHLSDILDRVGIENKNYFYKIFKAKMGISLSEYKTLRLSELAHGDKPGETD